MARDAARRLNVLTQALQNFAVAGLIGGIACGLVAVVLQRSLGSNPQHPSNSSGFPPLSGITAVAGWMAAALIGFSILYLIAGWGLSRRKSWARYTAAVVFLLKVLVSVWLGRASLASMTIFVLTASLDLYGIWVLLSTETAALFTSVESRQTSRKPANLVT